jgi:hypothetical protein
MGSEPIDLKSVLYFLMQATRRFTLFCLPYCLTAAVNNLRQSGPLKPIPGSNSACAFFTKTSWLYLAQRKIKTKQDQVSLFIKI